MTEGALPIDVGELSEHQHPTLVQGIEQGQRRFDGRMLGLGQFSPKIFLIGLDGWLVFGERELKTDIRVHVAVGKVMGYLAQGPTTVAVRSVELIVRESVESGAQAGGCQLDVGQEFLLLFGREWAAVGEFSDGIARVGHEVSSEAIDDAAKHRGAESDERGANSDC